MDRLRILIADDHAIVRMGLIALLEADDNIDVVGEADDGTSAIKKASHLKPDIVIMDLMMPGVDGITATREIHQKLPKTKILILTTSTVSDDLASAIKSGADGIVIKSAANSKLLTAIRTLATGRQCFAPEVHQMITDDPPAQNLTQRQLDILRSVTRGLTNADIANQFSISPESVRDHIDAIFAKLGAANRTEAVAIALRKHLLKI